MNRYTFNFAACTVNCEVCDANGCSKCLSGYGYDATNGHCNGNTAVAIYIKYNYIIHDS